MLPLTSRERLAVVFISGVFLLGLSLKLVFVLRPALSRHLTVLDEPSYRPRVNLNTASYDEILAVPFIGPSSAGRILRYRQTYGSIPGPETLAIILKKKPQEIERMRIYLEW